MLLTSCLLIRGKVSGKVMVEGAEGELMPLPAVNVELVDTNGNRIDTAFSGPAGDFIFNKRVKAGTYKCRTVPGGALGENVPVAESTVKVFKSRATCQVVVRLAQPSQ